MDVATWFFCVLKFWSRGLLAGDETGGTRPPSERACGTIILPDVDAWVRLEK